MRAIGLASGIGGNLPECGKGPLLIKDHVDDLDWHTVLHPHGLGADKYEAIAEINRKFARAAHELALQGEFFFGFGGDHSSAIGMWSGVASALRKNGDLGLLWIDAHMDAHTLETSESGNIHGMPLAVLLGHGDPRLVQIGDAMPKVKPENVALVGIRSFEDGEAELLKKLNVRIFFMEEVRSRGLNAVMEEALQIVTRGTHGYGISFDLDSIDPTHIKAVGTPVPDGIEPAAMLSFFSSLHANPPLAFELVEYNPSLDPHLESLQFISASLTALQNSLLGSSARS